MYVSKDFLLKKLPPFINQRVTVTNDQNVKDIIRTLITAHKENGWLYDKISRYFVGVDIDETCENLFQFCKKNLRYDEESEALQTVSVPQALLTWGKCDCKGYASFVCGVLSSIERTTGQKINWCYCFASYKLLEKSPYHVFSIVETNGGDIWIDPTPGADEKTPVWWVKETVKNSDMALQKVIGKINNADGRGIGAVANMQLTNNGFPATISDQREQAAAVLLNQSYVKTSGAVHYNGPVVPTGPAIEQPARLADGNSQVPNAPITIQPGVVPSPMPVPNGLPVDAGNPAETAKGINWLLIGGAGLGLFLLLKDKKNKAAGIGGKGKKGSMLPLLLIGGAAAYWLYTKNSGTDTSYPVDYIPASGGDPSGGGPATGGGGGAVSVITSPADQSGPVLNSVANSDLVVMKRDFPQYTSVFQLMSSAEIVSMYNYLYGYVSQGLKLYSGPGATGVYPDGGWNTVLYNQIAAIRTKYSLTV